MTALMKKAGRFGRVCGTMLLAAVAVIGPSGAQPAPENPKVLIGTTFCFQVRCADGSQSQQDRADQVQEVFARHLGGRGVFTLHKSGKSPASRVQIRLNGDPVITVTIQDAKATRFLNAEDLAPLWKQALEKAFNETSAAIQP